MWMSSWTRHPREYSHTVNSLFVASFFNKPNNGYDFQEKVTKKLF